MKHGHKFAWFPGVYGRAFYITDEAGEANVNQHVCILRPKENLISRFLYFILRTWTNLYAFLAQIMPFIYFDFEKFYAYAKLLQKRLPKRKLSESLHLDDKVALEYYRLQKIKEGSIDLLKGETGELSGTTEAGLKRAKDEEARLSEIIDVLNERFGTEFEEADKLFFDQIEAELMEDEKLQMQAKVNKIDTFKYAFEDLFITKLIDRMDQNQEIFEKIVEDKAFGDLVKELMMKKVYKRMNE